MMCIDAIIVIVVVVVVVVGSTTTTARRSDINEGHYYINIYYCLKNTF